MKKTLLILTALALATSALALPPHVVGRVKKSRWSQLSTAVKRGFCRFLARADGFDSIPSPPTYRSVADPAEEWVVFAFWTPQLQRGNSPADKIDEAKLASLNAGNSPHADFAFTDDPQSQFAAWGIEPIPSDEP